MQRRDCEKGCTGSMNDRYFIPLTINDLINGLKGIIKESDALSGNEYITDIQYIEDVSDVPPGSIALFINRGTVNPDESKYGTIVLTPGKTKTFM